MIAIDPGASTGWAFFGALSRNLIACGSLNPELVKVPSFFERGLVVIERPCDRPGNRKSSVNDLITLAIRAGIIAGQCHDATIRWIRPDEWKGQLSKELCHERTRAILTSAELAVIPKDVPHDTWDAIGLGLFALGRARRGMISNGP